MEFEEIINNQKEGKIDLRKLKCNPTTLLPLLCECKNHNLKLGNGEKAFEYLVNSLKDNELFSKLPESRVESDEVDFITEYMLNINCEYGGYFALRTVISEIANNVYDHSRQDCEDIQSYIFSKLDEHYKKLDITLVDDGASIPKVFELSNVDFDNDCKAIEKAIGVFSTISDDKYERGNGLWTIIRLIAEGNGGELLIISRAGCLHINGENYNYYLLDDEHIFNGTLIGIRLNKYEIQNIYDLIEINKPDMYKLGAINDY